MKIKEYDFKKSLVSGYMFIIDPKFYRKIENGTKRYEYRKYDFKKFIEMGIGNNLYFSVGGVLYQNYFITGIRLITMITAIKEINSRKETDEEKREEIEFLKDYIKEKEFVQIEIKKIDTTK